VLIYHLRTFATTGIVAAALLETKALREVRGEIVVDDVAQFILVMLTLVSNQPIGPEFASL
jgi:hypothetical protein